MLMEKDVDARPFKECFADEIRLMTQYSNGTTITKHNVLREGRRGGRRLLDSIIKKTLQPKSGIIGFENLQSLYQLCQQGYSTLILMEHYSNVDFPVLMYLLANHSHIGEQIGRAIIPMATIRLNEDDRAVSAFTDAYTHISIFPARRLEQISMSRSHEAERHKAREINHAAMRHMQTLKSSGHIILMFPSGTRYKSNKPETKRVLKIVDSFMKRFEYIILGGIMGTLLVVNDPKDMLSDYVRKDRMVYAFGAPTATKKFRAPHKKLAQNRNDLALRVTDQIEKELEKMHTVAESAYYAIAESNK